MSDKPEALQMADELDGLCSQYDSEIAAELRRLCAENEALKIELAEQARVNGMGSEREARLMALNSELAGLIQQIIDSRDEHFIDNCVDGMWGWDERANAALAKAEASK